MQLFMDRMRGEHELETYIFCGHVVEEVAWAHFEPFGAFPCATSPEEVYARLAGHYRGRSNGLVVGGSLSPSVMNFTVYSDEQAIPEFILGTFCRENLEGRPLYKLGRFLDAQILLESRRSPGWSTIRDLLVSGQN